MPKEHPTPTLDGEYTFLDNGIEPEVSRVFGLTTNEARIYLALVKGDEYSANRLSKITGIHRTRVYDNLRGLENKRFVTSSGSEPKLFKSRPIRETVLYTLKQLEEGYDLRRREIEAMETLLQRYESNRDIHMDPVYVVSLNETLNELSKLLGAAKNRVWVCKRIAGGIIDWFVLKDSLKALSQAGVDIRFLSDSPMHIGFSSRTFPSIGISFAIIDKTAISFFFGEEDDNQSRILVTTNAGFVDFLNNSFLHWWNLAD
ncbi:MAG: TrmB family transcriptional regulator [Candidatus Thorarchaeota archaeon]